MTHCPCHPDEVRDARFGLLDDLIRRGWGNCPMTIIERETRRNGGVLPAQPPPGYRGEMPEDYKEKLRRGGRRARGAAA